MAVGVGLKETDRLAVLKGFLKSERVCERFLVLESTTKDKPNVNVILSSLGFSVSAADSYKNIISAWVDKDGFFNEAFYIEYNKRLDEIRGSKDIYKIMKQDAAILDSIPVHKSFDLKNTFECISDNMDIKYYLPEGYKVAELDFEKPKLQIVRLVCVSESLPIPFSFMYHYRCGKCDVEVKSLHANAKHECPNCKMEMKRSMKPPQSMTVYVSKVMYEGNQIDAMSRVKLPMNQFDGAVIPMKNEDKYTLFLLAVGVPNPKESPLIWTGGDRMVELIHNIDRIHKERIGKSVIGLDHVKMSIIQCRMAGLMGNTASQALIIGAQGCGKSTVTKFYMFTLADKSAFRDATTVTHAGLLGSSEVVDVFGSRSPIMQLGLLERYEMVVLDEFLDKSNDDLNALKTTLSTTTITSEKHNNKREVQRNAVILAPSNIPDSHMKKIRYIASNTMTGFDESTFNIRAMPGNIKDQFASANQNWRDGEPKPFLDRFAFIFYIDSSVKGIGVIDEIAKSSEERIPDGVLRFLLYTKNVDEYLRECVKIKFKYRSEFDGPNLDRLIKKYCLPKGHLSEGFGDDIHSLERLNRYFRMMVECHALINQRDKSDDSDYVWLDKFYSKLCNFVYTDDLVWDAVKKEEVKEEDVGKRGEITYFILDYLTRCGKDGSVRENVLGACSMNGFDNAESASVLNNMVSENLIIFEPPNKFKVINDK